MLRLKGCNKLTMTFRSTGISPPSISNVQCSILSRPFEIYIRINKYYEMTRINLIFNLSMAYDHIPIYE